jgi:hypothetical protein
MFRELEIEPSLSDHRKRLKASNDLVTSLNLSRGGGDPWRNRKRNGTAAGVLPGKAPYARPEDRVRAESPSGGTNYRSAIIITIRRVEKKDESPRSCVLAGDGQRTLVPTLTVAKPAPFRLG